MGVKAKHEVLDLCSLPSGCPLPKGARTAVASQLLPLMSKGFAITTITNATDQDGKTLDCIELNFKAA
jgi:hypothetical protein